MTGAITDHVHGLRPVGRWLVSVRFLVGRHGVVAGRPGVGPTGRSEQPSCFKYLKPRASRLVPASPPGRKWCRDWERTSPHGLVAGTGRAEGDGEWRVITGEKRGIREPAR